MQTEKTNTDLQGDLKVGTPLFPDYAEQALRLEAEYSPSSPPSFSPPLSCGPHCCYRRTEEVDSVGVVRTGPRFTREDIPPGSQRAFPPPPLPLGAR